jgi:outer membrane protein TolC
MNSTRQQRKMFVKNAKKQWQKGEITKAEYLEIKAQIANMGKEQHAALQQRLIENNGVTFIEADSNDILDAELVEEEDFTPEDL